MKHHPYTEIWPLMSGDDFEKLKADIKANGQRLPVLIYQDQVLDGRNRELACEQLGIEARYEKTPVTTDTEALALVVSLNNHRRHLTMEQRAFAAARLAKLGRGGDYGNQYTSGYRSVERKPHETMTLNEAVEKIGDVSLGSAARAKIVISKGTAEDVEEVLSGKCKLHAKAESLHKRTPRKFKALPQPKTSYAARPSHPKYLKPHEVDPEFTGTDIEFIDKYGHVQIHTAEQFATMRFSDWAGYMKSLAKQARGLPPLPERPVDHNWLRSPSSSDIAKLTEALEYLRPRIAEAEALLATAVAAAKK